jgi:hypothetical protein
MSSVTMDVNGGFANKIDLSTPSNSMRELITTEAERWREMEKDAAGAKSLLARYLSFWFSRH